MTPDAVSAVYAQNLVSSFDLHKPEYLAELFSRYGTQGGEFFLMMKSLGWEEETSLYTYGHFEENRIHEVFHSRNIVADPGAGNDLVITLATQDLDASNRFYPRLYDTVMLANEVVGYIAVIDTTTPSAPVLTLRVNEQTDNFDAVAADEEISIISSQFSEGSGQPVGAFRGVTKYENDTQIMKETVTFTGSEMTNQSWTEVTSFGDNIPAYYMLGQKDIDFRMALKAEGALMFNKRTTNPNAIDPGNGRPINSTEGLIPFTRRTGNVYPSAAGSWTTADFNQTDRILDKEHTGKYIGTFLGIDKYQEVEDSMFEYFKDTNIDYTRKTMNEVLFNSSESLSASVNFKLFTKSERTYCFKRMGAFSNPKLFGASGFKAPQLALFIPLGKVKNPKPAEGEKSHIESIGCRYKGLGKYKRKMEFWEVGGAGSERKVTDIDESNTYQRAEIGAHYAGGNRNILVSPTL